ncbi:hypothetical protein K469DRAFT_690909 [Zopfia rhizophila CBS 207.26]|uniref:Uncharacterized protein n=1 Tax=Zopfia rhizophila CBS 207.26 TaxID=1314779 RepID=A0A6A6DS58_9PEZI|nr:hypothetical protein K469DRAFT_690909 [Zopfia rhizophila CBS 207.26]
MTYNMLSEASINLFNNYSYMDSVLHMYNIVHQLGAPIRGRNGVRRIGAQGFEKLTRGSDRIRKEFFVFSEFLTADYATSKGFQRAVHEGFKGPNYKDTVKEERYATIATRRILLKMKMIFQSEFEGAFPKGQNQFSNGIPELCKGPFSDFG